MSTHSKPPAHDPASAYDPSSAHDPSSADDSAAARHVEEVRRFNRFYTRQIGLLEDGLLKSPFTLAEARVIYEIAQREVTTATHLASELGLDAGYLSRILRTLQEREMIDRTSSESDRRRYLLSLSRRGHGEFAELNAASRAAVGTMLGGLSMADQDRLVHAMNAIEQLLGARQDQRVSYILRPPRTGDMGWVVYNHATLYNREYGWNESFEALVMDVVADFVRSFDAACERCWIAEREGQNVGCVFLVKHPDRDDVAKLRLLLVDPSARGLGIGRRLVQECTRFARQTGYRTITLWTNSVLHSARRIYEQEGYELLAAQPHHSFGHDLIGETWELDLDRMRTA